MAFRNKMAIVYGPTLSRHSPTGGITGATSRSRWPRLSFLVTYSPTSCAVSTGSDRRQDRCARIAGKNAIPRHQRRQLVLNHLDRREDGCHSKANCTSSGFESHSTDTQRAERFPYGESRIPSRCRRQDRCARTRRQKCHSAPPTPPIGPQSSGSARTPYLEWVSACFHRLEDVQPVGGSVSSHTQRTDSTPSSSWTWLRGFHMGAIANTS